MPNAASSWITSRSTRWVQRFSPELIDAARPSRHVAGDRWFVDETYLKVAGRWVYLYRAIDQYGQVIDVLASPKRDLAATRRFFARALNAARRPTEVTTDRAPAYPRVLDEVVPEAWHVVEQYANNPVEADHGRLKARTRPMRGLKRLRCAQVVCSGHAFIQNLRRGHYELGLDAEPGRRLEVIFTELALANGSGMVSLMSVDESDGRLAAPSPSQVRRRAYEVVQAVLSDDHNYERGVEGAWAVGKAALAEFGAVGLAAITVELSLQLASALEGIAAEQEIAAVDLADVWFLDGRADFLACGCREPSHVMRPARTRAEGHRAGLVAAAAWSEVWLMSTVSGSRTGCGR